MSTPISACIVSKAALGDEKAFQFLLKAMERNIECGHFLTVPCNCDPPCQRPTGEQIEAFDTRLREALDDLLIRKTRPKSHDKQRNSREGAETV
jgi:hypothetical protein